MNATGGFSGGCTSLTNTTLPGFTDVVGVTFDTFLGTTYGYVADLSANLWQCPMNVTGGFSGGCTSLTNTTLPGFSQTAKAVFATF